VNEIPSSAKIVIVGGGIIGCSTAYHLGKMGITDVVLLERHKLTSGSTFHAAGLVGQLRTSANITQLLGYSVDLYKSLEEETGLATGWKMNGGLRLACSEDRWLEVKRQATTARSFGLDMELLTAKEAQDLFPIMNVDDVVGAAFLPTDGQASPSDITAAMAKGARSAGVTIIEDVRVTGFKKDADRIIAVETDHGPILCDKAVNCAGQWARDVGALAGVSVPLVSVQHQYLITEPMEEIPRNLPTLRDPDRLTYYKEEVGGLVMGGYEPNPIPWAVNGLPQNFEFSLLDSDWDHFTPTMELALGRVPLLEKAGIKQLLNGPESFTPDGNFILGRAPECENFFVGAGFNAFGIASGGGAGMALAEWVVNDLPPYDLSVVDILRFSEHHRSLDWVRERTLEAYGRHYTIAWPSEEWNSARGVRKSPLYDRLQAAGAVFGEKLGWERPNWFAGSGEEQQDLYSMTRPNWFDAVGQEHKAVREAAGMFDQSSFGKFLLKGKNALDAWSQISASRIPEPDKLAYSLLLNDKGGVAADVIAVRLDQETFYIVTSTGWTPKDRDWISRRIKGFSDVEMIDVTEEKAVLSLMGPKSREILSKITEDRLTDDEFPFGAAKEITVAGIPVLALRVTFVGALGWELHVPAEQAGLVYDALMNAGKVEGLVNAGYRAIESLRLEKGYLAFGSDIGPDHNPFELGLGFAVDLKSEREFAGKPALMELRDQPLKKQMRKFFVDDPNITLVGRETIICNGDPVGWLSSAGFEYTNGKWIGLGLLRNPAGFWTGCLEGCQFELESAGKTHRCKLV
jgi:sarcosine dehydrogenase